MLNTAVATYVLKIYINILKFVKLDSLLPNLAKFAILFENSEGKSFNSQSFSLWQRLIHGQAQFCKVFKRGPNYPRGWPGSLEVVLRHRNCVVTHKSKLEPVATLA